MIYCKAVLVLVFFICNSATHASNYWNVLVSRTSVNEGQYLLFDLRVLGASEKEHNNYIIDYNFVEFLKGANVKELSTVDNAAMTALDGLDHCSTNLDNPSDGCFDYCGALNISISGTGPNLSYEEQGMVVPAKLDADHFNDALISKEHDLRIVKEFYEQRLRNQLNQGEEEPTGVMKECLNKFFGCFIPKASKPRRIQKRESELASFGAVAKSNSSRAIFDSLLDNAYGLCESTFGENCDFELGGASQIDYKHVSVLVDAKNSRLPLSYVNYRPLVLRRESEDKLVFVISSMAIEDELAMYGKVLVKRLESVAKQSNVTYVFYAPKAYSNVGTPAIDVISDYLGFWNYEELKTTRLNGYFGKNTYCIQVKNMYPFITPKDLGLRRIKVAQDTPNWQLIPF